MWDVFISHASEDKAEIADPFVPRSVHTRQLKRLTRSELRSSGMCVEQQTGSPLQEPQRGDMSPRWGLKKGYAAVVISTNMTLRWS
jgi:hypothetical protein